MRVVLKFSVIDNKIELAVGKSRIRDLVRLASSLPENFENETW